MKMRTIVPLLAIAVTFCFVPVTSNCIKDGKDEQASVVVPSCLQKAMAENSKAVNGVIEFLCSYINYKDIKEELIKAIENLEDVTGCSTEDIFGSGASLEQVAMTENGLLTSQKITMEKLLETHVLLPITKSVCALLNSIEKSQDFVTQSSEGEVQGKKRNTRDLLNLVGGLTGSLDGIGGLLNLLSLVGKLAQLLEPIIGLLGNLLDGLSGVTNLVGGLGNGVTGLLGGLTGGLLGGGQKQGDLLGNLLGGVGGTLGGLTNTLGGLTGSAGQATQGLGGLTGTLTGLTGGLTGGLLGGGKASGGSSLLGGLLGR